MRPACAMPQTPVSRPSRCVVCVHVDARACRSRAHPSAQGQDLTVEPSPPLARGVARRCCGSVSTSRAVSFVSRSWLSCRAAVLLAGTHAHGGSRAKRTPAQTRAAACTAMPRAWWPAVQSRGLLAVRGCRGVLREAVGSHRHLVADPSQR
jgi:hypothetical protein